MIIKSDEQFWSNFNEKYNRLLRTAIKANHAHRAAREQLLRHAMGAIKRYGRLREKIGVKAEDRRHRKLRLEVAKMTTQFHKEKAKRGLL